MGPFHTIREELAALGKEVSLKAMILDYPRHFRLHLKEIEELLQD
jgi:hypothetical protein